MMTRLSSIYCLKSAILIAFAIVSVATAGSAVAKDELFFSSIQGTWKNAAPAFTELVTKDYFHSQDSNGADGWTTSANRLIRSNTINPNDYSQYSSLRVMTKQYFVDDVAASIDKFDQESRYTFFGLHQISQVTKYYVGLYKKNGQDRTDITAVKGNFPFDKGSEFSYTDFRYKQIPASPVRSLGVVNNYPREIAPYAPIVAIVNQDEKVIAYWSETLRWPVMGISPKDGSITSIVVGATVGGKTFGESYQQASDEIAASPIAVAAREHKAAQGATMFNQLMAGVATFATQATVGNAAVRSGHAAPALIVPNVNAADGGASAMAINQKIIAASLASSASTPEITTVRARANSTNNTKTQQSTSKAPSYIPPASQSVENMSTPTYRNHPELEAGRCLTFHGPIDIYGERVTNNCGYPVAFTFCIDGAHSALACKVGGNDIGSGSDTIGAGQTQDTGYVDARGASIQNHWHACKGKLGEVTPMMQTRNLGTCMSY